MSTSDDITPTKGYIMHKMYYHGYFYKKKPKHTPIENLQKGCPLDLRTYVSTAINELIKEELLKPKSTSHGRDVSAVECREGYTYANIYEGRAGLPLSKQGEPAQPTFKIPPLDDKELRALKLRKKK